MINLRKLPITVVNIEKFIFFILCEVGSFGQIIDYLPFIIQFVLLIIRAGVQVCPYHKKTNQYFG